jgi:hypothetical protein
MKSLLQILFVLLVSAVLFNSCKKSSSPAPVTPASSSSMSLTYNNTVLAFIDCNLVSGEVNNVPQTIILADNITGSKVSDNSFEVEITADVAKLKSGAVFQAATSFAQANALTLFFFPDTTNTYATQPANHTGVVTITDVSATYVKGTFSGKLFASDDFNATSLLYGITNGSFVAKRTDN